MEIKTEILVAIEYYDGQEEGDTGHPYYTASSDDLHFVTDGATFEELLANIRECLVLCLEDRD
jgi:predicted RNase H-like HicB family nuclease